MNFKLRFSSIIAIALLLGSCTSDPTEPQTPAQPETPYFEAPITIGFGSQFDIDVDASRAAPPGSGDQGETGETLTPDDGIAEYESVNEVRVLTFRRKEYSDEQFVYDAANDLTLEIETDGMNAEHGHAHHQATGRIKKVSGYEYKIVAIAYDNARVSTFKAPAYANRFALQSISGDQNRIKLNISDGLKLEDLRGEILTEEIGKTRNDWNDFFLGHQYAGLLTAFLDSEIINGKFLSQRAAEVPQIFFGECQTETGHDVISFIEELPETDGGTENLVQKTDVGIRGILYRGMAKVDVNITVKKHNLSDVGLPLENRSLNWLCLLVEGMNSTVGLHSYDDFLTPASPVGLFTAVSYRDLDGVADGATVTLTTYLLPGKYRLAIRSKTPYGTTGHLHDGLIVPQDVESFGNGTGIVSADTNNGYFYFRRNHKYVLNISDSEKILQNHELK